MQMQTLSARIPTEDLEWLVGLDVQGAVSPSDKLRALIGQLRRQHEGAWTTSAAWTGCAIWWRPSSAPSAAFEHENRMHSEVLTLVDGSVPQIMATLLSERGLGNDAKKRAIEVEEIVVQRCFQLLTSILRLAVTRDAACYNPKVIDAHVPPVLEIAEIVAQTRKMREKT